MTTRQKLESMLVATGMFESQAKQVMDVAIPELNKQSPGGYNITWDSDASGYPDMLYALWFMSVKIVALKWIDANCPKAWFRPMFDDKQLETFKMPAIPITSGLRTHEDQKLIMEEVEKHAPSSRSPHNDQSLFLQLIWAYHIGILYSLFQMSDGLCDDRAR